ncbi:hypothetical protein [Mesorhizobium sp. RMAD-H1]|uniref:hypothetical protein n=1 Tax=Mesorhizobium sp. RMAD-H1 TaxID=2587065 RepID=UPI00161A01B8|nr:hypothetical protein [Mesorhizobium sp. RMAD-H1]MBB2970318.1 Mg/Co/Ni transporter MgtE [Mesorhizobium sp. RMAD-H1]
MSNENDDQPIDVFALLHSAAESRVKLARPMLDAYAADALDEPPTPDIAYWKQELADTEIEFTLVLAGLKAWLEHGSSWT